MDDKKLYPGFERYIIYEDGRVFSEKTKRFLKPTLYNTGYLYVSLCNKGAIKKIAIHRLIAELFIDNPDNKPQVNHKDMNRTNNSISNLEWVTLKENLNHAWPNIRAHKGQSLSIDQVLVIKKHLSDGRFPKAIGTEMGIDYRIIAQIKRGRNYARI